MNTSRMSFILTIFLVAFEIVSGVMSGVWPPPQSISLHGEPVALAPNFQAAAVEYGDGRVSDRLQRAIARFNALVRPIATISTWSDGHAVLRRLDVKVVDMSEDLGVATNYSYTLNVSADTRAYATAPTIYGAMYALETFAQLVDVHEGTLVATSVQVVDAPKYAWRGLLVDSGRRFAPPWLLENIIDTMAAVKLNVLHLHLSDFCRFGVQSLRFPNLTARLQTGPDAGFYTHKDVEALIAYAGDRGVRIVPEFEVPGHALGFLPIASRGGLEFCATCAYGPTGDGRGTTCRPSQLWGTEGTIAVLKAVLGEMAALFPDPVFHIGADETFVKPGPGERCTANTTAFMEKAIVRAVERDFQKVPAGWEQVLFKTEAATNDTIVYAYMSGASKVTATGHRAVVANGSSLYFTTAAPGGPAGWGKLWYDIGFDVPGSERALLLGAEMSMWTDTYCSPRECGAMPAYHTEKGGALYNRSRDKEYGRSLGGMIWPRGYVGAAAFWNWNKTLDARSAEFTSNIWTLNDALAARGALVCPSNCSCDQMSACGKPYLVD